MIDIEFSRLEKGIGAGQLAQEIGIWLDENMPNPPLPEPQRWTIGHSEDERPGIRFENEQDATLFMLRWL